MHVHVAHPTPIEITQTLVRLYIFLAQTMDRALTEDTRPTSPNQDIESRSASARSEVMTMLSVNRAIRLKVEEDCRRVQTLVAAHLKGGIATAIDELKAARHAMTIKITTLSDLLAVFRAA